VKRGIGEVALKGNQGGVGPKWDAGQRNEKTIRHKVLFRVRPSRGGERGHPSEIIAPSNLEKEGPPGTKGGNVGPPRKGRGKARTRKVADMS